MYDHNDGISLRKIQQSDLKSLLSLKNESWWGTHDTPIINLEDQENWYSKLTNRTIVMMAEVKRDESSVMASVGVALLSNIDWIGRTLNLSGSIFKEQRKSNLVKPAFACGLDFCFEILNMERVGAEVLETHLAAQKLEVDYLGFKVEGRRRKAVYKSGVYYDSIVLGILKEEWENTLRVKTMLETNTLSCNKNFDHNKAQRLISRSSIN